MLNPWGVPPKQTLGAVCTALATYQLTIRLWPQYRMLSHHVRPGMHCVRTAGEHAASGRHKRQRTGCRQLSTELLCAQVHRRRLRGKGYTSVAPSLLLVTNSPWI